MNDAVSADDLFDEWNSFEPAGYNEDARDAGHRLQGAPWIDDYYEPLDPRAFTPVLRVTFDNAADFGWGTNWIALSVARETDPDVKVGDTLGRSEPWPPVQWLVLEWLRSRQCDTGEVSANMRA
ncbi:MAG: hypothetical protein SFX73_12740 [Kofleriaceae bacterium]|nr:hypothetical protein [Kofleriaceae bacterium]